MSTYFILPALTAFLRLLLVWYGRRLVITSVSTSAVSISGPTDAPENSSICSFSPFFARSARASGTAFGYPDGVNPLTPTTMPSSINFAASSADIISSSARSLLKRFFNSKSNAILHASLDCFSHNITVLYNTSIHKNTSSYFYLFSSPCFLKTALTSSLVLAIRSLPQCTVQVF